MTPVAGTLGTANARLFTVPLGKTLELKNIIISNDFSTSAVARYITIYLVSPSGFQIPMYPKNMLLKGGIRDTDFYRLPENWSIYGFADVASVVKYTFMGEYV